MAETAIEWATPVWNPVTGCSRVSPYAGRLKAMGKAKYQRDGGRGSGPGFGVTLHEHELDAPATWRAPRRVFVNSMSDLFHEEIPDDFIRRVFVAMEAAAEHTFIVLTKRADRMQELLARWATPIDPTTCCDGCVVCWKDYSAWFPLPNVWLGVSIENRRFGHRADLLRATPAAVRFISAEPLLGPLVRPGEAPGLDLTGIDWLIAGGESGPKHRAPRAEWIRDLRDACAEAQTAFFFKQDQLP